MKILFLVYGLVASKTDGRVTTARYFAHALAKNNKIIFLSTGPKKVKFKEQGVEYEVVKTGDGLGFVRSCIALASLIKKEKPDVVEYHPPAGFNILNVKYMLLLSALCRSLSTPFVVYLWGGPTQIMPFKKFFSKIITPTQEKGFEWVPPAVDKKKFSPSKRSPGMLKKLGMKGKKTVLFMTGARFFSKEVFDYLLNIRGMTDFIKASRMVPQADFIISVPCLESGEGRKALDSYLRTHAGRQIKIIGDADAAKLLASVDAHVFPYQREEPLFLPVSIIESFASGTPVVAGNLEFTRKIIEDRKTGFLYEIGNAHSLAEKISEALQPSERKKVISNALKEAGKYAPEKSAGKLLQLLKGVAKAKHRA